MYLKHKHPLMVSTANKESSPAPKDSPESLISCQDVDSFWCFCPVWEAVNLSKIYTLLRKWIEYHVPGHMAQDVWYGFDSRAKLFVPSKRDQDGQGQRYHIFYISYMARRLNISQLTAVNWPWTIKQVANFPATKLNWTDIYNILSKMHWTILQLNIFTIEHLISEQITNWTTLNWTCNLWTKYITKSIVQFSGPFPLYALYGR